MAGGEDEVAVVEDDGAVDHLAPLAEEGGERLALARALVQMGGSHRTVDDAEALRLQLPACEDAARHAVGVDRQLRLADAALPDGTTGDCRFRRWHQRRIADDAARARDGHRVQARQHLAF